MSAASISFYVFLYSIYFYMVKTKMTGLLQFSFYFGYTLLLCLGLGLVCGTIGYSATKLFVSRIYKDLKAD
jgi:transmembrane 9 superfamily member 3